MNQFGERMHELMQVHGLNERMLAERIGAARSTVANYKSGVSFPPPQTMRQIVKVLGTSCDYLYGLTDDTGCGNADIGSRYWSNICQTAGKQRAKGIRTYGQGIEDNPESVAVRIEYLEEELVDALMYLEWIYDGLKGHVSRQQYNECYDECLRLRAQNEQLMDALREKGDDGK